MVEIAWCFGSITPIRIVTTKWCFLRKDGTNRWWISYNKDKHSLHCSVCIAFSITSDRSAFIDGMTDWRHIHARIEEHERFSLNLRCSKAYLVDQQQNSIAHLLTHSRQDEVRKRRQFMERIIDVVKLIGKQGWVTEEVMRNQPTLFSMIKSTMVHSWK